MGFKRGALLGPFELLHLEQSADFVCPTSLSGVSVQSPGLSALGSLRRTPWRKCQPPAFSSLHFLAPLLLGAPAVARKQRCLPCPEGEAPPPGFQWGEGALLWPSTYKAPFGFLPGIHQHSLAHRFIFTFCQHKLIVVLVLIIRHPIIKDHETMFLRTHVN